MVILPGWEELCAWRVLSASAHLRARVVVAAADHGAQAHTSLCGSKALTPGQVYVQMEETLHFIVCDVCQRTGPVSLRDPTCGALSGGRLHCRVPGRRVAPEEGPVPPVALGHGRLCAADQPRVAQVAADRGLPHAVWDLATACISGVSHRQHGVAACLCFLCQGRNPPAANLS